MLKDITYFRSFFIDVKKKNDKYKGYSEYGSRVMPILEEYKQIDSSEERKAFKSALESLLEDEDKDLRSFAVDICLGFFILRDAIK